MRLEDLAYHPLDSGMAAMMSGIENSMGCVG